MVMQLLPLRVTHACNFRIQLSQWLNQHNKQQQEQKESPDDENLLPRNAACCRKDLQRLHELRSLCVSILDDAASAAATTAASSLATSASASSGAAADAVVVVDQEDLETLQEYAAALDDLIQKGFPTGASASSGTGRNFISLSWGTASSDASNIPITMTMTTRHDDLLWERLNVLWNIAALTANQVSHQTSKIISASASPVARSLTPMQLQAPWKQASAKLEQAAHLIQYISIIMNQQQQQKSTAPTFIDDLFFSPPALGMYQYWLCTQAQRFGYVLFKISPTPKHMMLAKFAAGLVKFLSTSIVSCQQVCKCVIEQQQYQQQLNQNLQPQNRALLQFIQHYWVEWKDTLQSWNLFWSAMQEYHQAKVCSEKRAGSVDANQEPARIENSCRFGRAFLEQLQQQQQQQRIDGEMLVQMAAFMREMHGRMEQLEENGVVSATAAADLPKVQATVTVKLGASQTILPAELSKLLPSLSQPLFEHLEDIADDDDNYEEEETDVDDDSHDDDDDSHDDEEEDGASGGGSDSRHEDYSVDEGSGVAHRDDEEEEDDKHYQPQPKSAVVAAAKPPPLKAETYDIIERFRQHTQKMCLELEGQAVEVSERARRALNTMNLPHALMQYKTELETAAAGGGQNSWPHELWDRVQQLQRRNIITELKRQSWELQDSAQTANGTFHQILRNLDEDAEMDTLFREQHEDFEGFDVHDLQARFREALQRYAKLLETARNADEILMEKFETLDTDPKFKLLKFEQSELEKLLPNAKPPIDVSELTQALLDLSALLNQRKSLVDTVKANVSSYNLMDDISSQMVDNQYVLNEAMVCKKAIEKAEKMFKDLFKKVHGSFGMQDSLLQSIEELNKDFGQAREAQASRMPRNGSFGNGNNAVAVAAGAGNGFGVASAANSVLGKIEDALNDIDVLGRESKNGMEFYEVMLPKLNNLKCQVADVSARLANERCEYEERVVRLRQEINDARMAETLANQRATSNALQQSSSPPPSSGVDDDKVASLVDMGIDPEKAVQALKKFYNDFDQALNECLCE